MMKILVGLALGFLSGILIYMAAAVLSMDTDTASIAFFGGWALSTFVIVRRARTVSGVLSRGCLLGAAEWLAMAPLGVILRDRLLSATVDEDLGAIIGLAITAGIIEFTTVGVAVAMTLICGIGFAVAFFMERRRGRELQTEQPPEPDAATTLSRTPFPK